jgi:hypothetical protein
MAASAHPPIYTMTFEELTERAERGETLVTYGGHLICSRDRKFNPLQARYAWNCDRDIAKFKGLLPASCVNKKGKPFTWSPSAINDFITCPMKYAAARFYFTTPYVESEAMRLGTMEHKFLEDRIALKKPLPDGYTRGEKFCLALEKATANGGKLIAEREMAISRDMKLVGWFDKNAWGRCKIDVAAIVGDKCSAIDWKTGKPKDDMLQLKINICFLALAHPEINKFTGRYVWLKTGEMTPKGDEGVFTREQIPDLWAEILGHTKRMEQAWRSEVFNARSSGLCRNWCDVTTCPHCGKGK